jgi:hypothetical protein
MVTGERNRIWTLEELMLDDSTPPEPFVADGILLPNSLLLIHGSPKVGKSFLTMNLAVALAGGRNFAGFRIPKPRRVLMLSAEGGYVPNRNRLQKMCRAVSGQSAFWENLFVCFDWREPLDSDDGLVALKDSIEQHRPEILIIDPLVRFHQGEENSATDMARVFRVFRNLMEDYELSIVLVHHAGKNVENGARGSSVIQGEYDSSIRILKTNAGIQLEFDMRHVETPAKKSLVFNRDTLWFEQRMEDPLVKILWDASRALSKKQLADALVEAGRYSRVSGAYKAIDKAVQRKQIELSDEGKFVPAYSDSPFSISTGERLRVENN